MLKKIKNANNSKSFSTFAALFGNCRGTRRKRIEIVFAYHSLKVSRKKNGKEIDRGHATILHHTCHAPAEPLPVAADGNGQTSHRHDTIDRISQQEGDGKKQSASTGRRHRTAQPIHLHDTQSERACHQGRVEHPHVEEYVGIKLTGQAETPGTQTHFSFHAYYHQQYFK